MNDYGLKQAIWLLSQTRACYSLEKEVVCVVYAQILHLSLFGSSKAKKLTEDKGNVEKR